MFCLQIQVKSIFYEELKICLYLSIISYGVFLNNGFSFSIEVKSIVTPGQYDAKCSWWFKQDAYRLGKVVSNIWLVCFGLLSPRPCQLSRPWFQLKNFIKRPFNKYLCSTLFDQPTPCTVYSVKSVRIVTECISNHDGTNKHNNCRNNSETLNIASCQSVFNFVKKK